MRALGIDVGERRVGLAVSDPSGTLATPHVTIERRGSLRDLIEQIADEIRQLSADEPITAIVVGLPLRLDGTPNEATSRARHVAAALGERAGVPVVFQDERLSSREAESRLAVRERDWRKRKKRLDAAAAAVILQDYLDTRGSGGAR
jgi:putative Holliday junction resolvase